MATEDDTRVDLSNNITSGLVIRNFGYNQFPIQNFYLREVVKDTDGVVTSKIIDTVFENHGDAYAQDCKF